MKENKIFDYGEEGSISVTILDEEDNFTVYAKAYVRDEFGMDIPGTGLGDEGS